MSVDALELRRRELAELTSRLNEQLHRGLLERMRHASWYLTGVQIGLESLKAYYEISELVYREHTSRSEGGRRLGNLRHVYDQLSRFASGGTVDERAGIMLEIRRPLQTLLREFRGWDADGQEAMRQRKTIISQLAADIRLSLLRLRSFEKMQQDLVRLQSPMFWLARKAKREAAERLRHDHIGYAGEFGFGDAEVLLDGKVVKETLRKVERATRKLDRLIGLVHQKLYRDRYAQQATADKKADLAEARTMPILQGVSKAGFEYLDRANAAYEHSLQLVGGDMQLLARVTELGAQIEEIEIAQV